MPDFNTVTINLPVESFATYGETGIRSVHIDGMKIEGVQSVDIRASVGEPTTVILEFYAHVRGNVRAALTNNG